MSFFFKKTISFLLNPLSLSLELVILGLALIIFARWRSKNGEFSRGLRRCFNSGVVFAVLGIFVLYLASLNPVSNAMLGYLETQIAPLPVKGGKVLTEVTPEFIVVLAGGERAAPNKPALSGLTHHAFARVVGATVFREQFPDAKMAFTGRPDETGAMRDVAERLGVPAGSIVEETQSRDTKDHPILLKPILQDAPFFLVTSASHMPRAVALFRNQGLDPVAAPVGFVAVTERDERDPHHYSPIFPSAENLAYTTTAVHEILGLTWAKMRGQID